MLKIGKDSINKAFPKRMVFCIYFPYKRCGQLSCFSCEPVSGKIVACPLFCGGSGFTRKRVRR